MEFLIQRAKLSDMPQVHKLITYFAEQDEMLHRPLSELYENVRDYYVIKEGDEVIACGSLHIVWDDLAEGKAVGGRGGLQDPGLGERPRETLAAPGQRKKSSPSTASVSTRGAGSACGWIRYGCPTAAPASGR